MQKSPVNVRIVIGSTEKMILNAIHRKENDHNKLKKDMQEQLNKVQEIRKGVKYKMDYERKEERGKDWRMILGDSIEEIKELDSNLIHFTIFSPPFSTLYIYSDSYRDMGNTKNDEEFFKHFDFLIPELYRITIPNRLIAVHCKQLVNYKNRDGRFGLRDFRGDIIRAFQKYNWVYHSEICIWKDPVAEMYRTKAHGLLYRQVRKDASYSRQGLADYLLIFRKWAEIEGENKEPVIHKKETFELEKWQKYASPVWFDINQMNCLNIEQARNNKDEKHICPLQLDVIERAIELWSNPREVVFSPFAGIGSEGYQALEMNRRFIGIELKEEYFNVAVKNLRFVIQKRKQIELF